MGSRQEAKLEKQVKDLLRQGANKTCINCDNKGPQYAVMSFNVFACTTCSGVHRQFGHRVKGVSMSSFKLEEVEALKKGGNEAFAHSFLSTWDPHASPKPASRAVALIESWIKKVYVERCFYKEPVPGESPRGVAQAAPQGVSRSSSRGSSQGQDSSGVPAVRPLSEVMGAQGPRLQVGSPLGSKPAASSPAPAAAPGPSFDALIDMDAPNSPNGKHRSPPPAPRVADPPPAAPAPVAPAALHAAQHQQQQQTQDVSWATFGDAAWGAAPPTPAPTPVAGVPLGMAGMDVPQPSDWEAFSRSPPSAPPPAPPAPQPEPAPQASRPPPPPPRHEVPLEAFYPEFEQIRATGRLPTGEYLPGLGQPLVPSQAGYGPVPWIPGVSGLAGPGRRPAPPAPPQLHVPSGGYPSPERGAWGAAPQAYASPDRHAAPAQQAYASPDRHAAPAQQAGYYSPQPYASPSQAPPALPSPHLPPAPAYASPQRLAPNSQGWAEGPSWSTSSQAGGGAASGSHGWSPQGTAGGPPLGPGSASSAGGAQSAIPTPDPFSSLGPVFNAALDGAARPASVPPAPGVVAKAAPQAPSPQQPLVLPSVAAGVTLFGRQQASVAALPYDLSAPMAPRPAASGNPFA